jgi:hypothetical protein
MIGEQCLWYSVPTCENHFHQTDFTCAYVPWQLQKFLHYPMNSQLRFSLHDVLQTENIYITNTKNTTHDLKVNNIANISVLFVLNKEHRLSLPQSCQHVRFHTTWVYQRWYMCVGFCPVPHVMLPCHRSSFQRRFISVIYCFCKTFDTARRIYLTVFGAELRLPVI